MYHRILSVCFLSFSPTANHSELVCGIFFECESKWWSIPSPECWQQPSQRMEGMGNRALRDPLYPCAHTGERPHSKEKLLFLWGANRNLHAPCNCFLYCFLFLLVCGSCFAEATGLCYGQIERKWSFFIYIKKQLLKRTLCPRISMVESVWDFLGLLFSIQTLWEPQPGSWYITSMKY